jgi:hypothetical protein
LPAIFPRYVAPVVRRAPDGERELVNMSWGFMLLQQCRAPRPVTNVRDAAHEFVLVLVVRAEALPRAGVLVLRAERGCRGNSDSLLTCTPEPHATQFFFLPRFTGAFFGAGTATASRLAAKP